MKTALLATTLLFLTLNSSCTVSGAQPAAKPAAKEAAAQQPKADPRFDGIAVEYHDQIRQFEKTQPRMMSSWFKLRELYPELHHCAHVFGLRERKNSRKKVPGLLAKIESEKTKFFKAYDKARAPIEKEEGKLKDRAMKLSDTGNHDDPLVDKRLDELYSAAYVLRTKLNAYDDLQAVFSRAGTSVKDDIYYIGISSSDSIAKKVALDNPRLVEARMTILDCEADLARLAELKAAMEKDPKQRWGHTQESQVKTAQRYMDKAVAILEKEAVRAKLPFTRDAAKWKKKVEDTEKKIADLEKRKRKTTTYDQRLSDYSSEQDNAEEAIALIDKIAAWKNGAAKKPKRKKKGGH